MGSDSALETEKRNPMARAAAPRGRRGGRACPKANKANVSEPGGQDGIGETWPHLHTGPGNSVCGEWGMLCVGMLCVEFGVWNFVCRECSVWMLCVEFCLQRMLCMDAVCGILCPGNSVCLILCAGNAICGCCASNSVSRECCVWMLCVDAVLRLPCWSTPVPRTPVPHTPVPSWARAPALPGMGRAGCAQTFPCVRACLSQAGHSRWPCLLMLELFPLLDLPVPSPGRTQHSWALSPWVVAEAAGHRS